MPALILSWVVWVTGISCLKKNIYAYSIVTISQSDWSVSGHCDAEQYGGYEAVSKGLFC